MYKKILGATVAVAILGTTAVQARSNGGLLFGAAALVIGTAVAIANSTSKDKPKKKYKKRSHHKKRYHKKKAKKTIIVTNEIKVQKTLKKMGYYDGKIDGNINGPISREAIRKMNVDYGISDNTQMTNETRDRLVLISDLFTYDEYMNTASKKKLIKGKRIQTALTVHGVYKGKIDGKVGKMTKQSIASYKTIKNLGKAKILSSNDEYNMVIAAIEINKGKIHEELDSLKRKSLPPVINSADLKVASIKENILPKETERKENYSSESKQEELKIAKEMVSVENNGSREESRKMQLVKVDQKKIDEISEEDEFIMPDEE